MSGIGHEKSNSFKTPRLGFLGRELQVDIGAMEVESCCALKS